MLSELWMWLVLHKNWVIGYGILQIFNGLIICAYPDKTTEVMDTLYVMLGGHIEEDSSMWYK